MAARVSVIKGISVVAANIALLRPPVGIDEVPIMIAAAVHQENPVEGFVFQELNAVRQLKLSNGSRRFARQKHWIIFEEISLTVFVKIARPFLKRRDSI